MIVFESVIFNEQKKEKRQPYFEVILGMLIILGFVAKQLEVLTKTMAYIFFLVPMIMLLGYQIAVKKFGKKEELNGYFSGSLKLDSHKILISEAEIPLDKIQRISFICDNIYGSDRYSHWTGHSVSNGEKNQLKIELRDKRTFVTKFKLLSMEHAQTLKDWIIINKSRVPIEVNWTGDLVKINI